MRIIGIGLIGLGRWGTRYVETLSKMKSAQMKWVFSRTKQRIKDVEKLLPLGVKKTTNSNDILKDRSVDAVIIASVASTHYALAKRALMRGKHVLVEKPIAFSEKEVRKLVQLAKRKKKVLMAGHVQCYNPGIRKLEQDIRKGVFGKMYYMHFLHANNGPVRKDIGVVLDFFPHTVSILSFLTKKMPVGVQALGASYSRNGNEDISIMGLSYRNGMLATATSGWIFPERVMRVTIVGERCSAVFDDYAKKEKLKYVWGKGKDGKKLPTYMAKFQKISDRRPLEEELEHFFGCIVSGKAPLTGGKHAIGVAKVLDSVQESMKKKKRVKI